jgi:hypothetical protein
LIVVEVGYIAELGRADEREVSRVEEEHGPLSLQVGFRDLDEFSVVEGGGLERLDDGIDQRAHGIVSGLRAVRLAPRWSAR